MLLNCKLCYHCKLGFVSTIICNCISQVTNIGNNCICSVIVIIIIIIIKKTHVPAVETAFPVTGRARKG